MKIKLFYRSKLFRYENNVYIEKRETVKYDKKRKQRKRES